MSRGRRREAGFSTEESSTGLSLTQIAHAEAGVLLPGDLPVGLNVGANTDIATYYPSSSPETWWNQDNLLVSGDISGKAGVGYGFWAGGGYGYELKWNSPTLGSVIKRIRSWFH